MKKLFAVLSIAFLTGHAFASGESDGINFDLILQRHRLSIQQIKQSREYRLLGSVDRERIQESAFCYKDATGVHGKNTDELRNIASVSKIFTTLLAIDHFQRNLDLTFPTKFHVIKMTKAQLDGTSLPQTFLYIEGSKDPTFNYNNLTLLAGNLRAYGKFNQIVFNSEFIAYDTPPSGNPVSVGSPGMTKYALQQRFRTTVIQTEQSVEEFVQGKLLSGFTLSNDQPNVFVHDSYSLRKILKIMNVESDNAISNILFNRVPNPSEILAKYDFTEDQIQLFNGSGYPIGSGIYRKDNQASCESVLHALGLLSGCLENECVQLPEVFQKSCDGGTLRSFNFQDNPELQDNVIAKTGTSRFARTLAGWIEGEENVSFAFLLTAITNRRSEGQRFSATAAIRESIGELYDTLEMTPSCSANPISFYPTDEFSFYRDSVTIPMLRPIQPVFGSPINHLNPASYRN
jgi:hypothetical protein